MTRKYLVINSIVFVVSLFFVIRYSNLPLLTGNRFLEFLFYSDSSHKADAFSISASVFAAYVFFVVNDFFPKFSESRGYKKRSKPLVRKILINISNVFRNFNSQVEYKIDFPIVDWDSDFIPALINMDKGNNAKILDINEESKILSGFGFSENKPIKFSMKYVLLNDLNSTLTSIERLRRIATIRNHAIDLVIDKLEEEIQLNIENINLLGHHEKSSILIFSRLEKIYFQSEALVNLFYDEYLEKEKLSCDIWNNKNYKKQADNITINEIMDVKSIVNKYIANKK